MTNREYLIQNPNEMNKMLRLAHEYAEREFGYHGRMTMADDEMLDKWLDAEYDKNAMPRQTYIVNIAVVMHSAKNEDDAAAMGEWLVDYMKNRIAILPDGIDDITGGKIQCFEI